MESSRSVGPANGTLDHDPAKLQALGREKRRISGPGAVTQLRRWKNGLRAYRRCLDDEIEQTANEIDLRMAGGSAAEARHQHW